MILSKRSEVLLTHFRWKIQISGDAVHKHRKTLSHRCLYKMVQRMTFCTIKRMERNVFSSLSKTDCCPHLNSPSGTLWKNSNSKFWTAWMKKTTIRVSDKSSSCLKNVNSSVAFSSSKEADLSSYQNLRKQMVNMWYTTFSLCCGGSLHPSWYGLSDACYWRSYIAQTVPSVTQNDTTQNQPPKVLDHWCYGSTSEYEENINNAGTLRPARGIHQAHCIDDRLQWKTNCIWSISGSVTEEQDPSKKSFTSTEIEVHRLLTMFLKELMSSSKAKSSLTAMFAEALLQHFSSTNNFKLVVVSGTKIKSYNFEENHTQEKADTLILHRVLASMAAGRMTGAKYVFGHQTPICWQFSWILLHEAVLGS